MDSKLNARSRGLILAAAVLSGIGFYFCVGLWPHWWLMWVAAVPVLLVAPRVPWGWALFMAAAARILGGLSMWDYYRGYILHLPLGVALLWLLTPVVPFMLAVLLFRSFFRRGRIWLGVLAFPAVIVAYEFGVDHVFGTFGNTAYTQLNNLPVLQLAALTGMWGISFVVAVFASALACAILNRGRTRRRLAFALVVLLISVYGYGFWRLRTMSPAPHTVEVGLVSTAFPENIFPSSDSAKIQLLTEYAAQARALAGHGAKIVVLPEMTVLASGSLSDEVDRLFEQTAHEANAQVLLGVLHVTSHGAFNEARLYAPSGQIEAVYRKRHLVPGAEARTTPVRDYSVLDQPEGTVGLAICRDLDYPDPARGYGKDHVGLLLVPAWDAGVDRWWHGHMALMRGVEYGFSIVRSAKTGFLTVSDDRGRVLAETAASSRVPFTTLLASVPVRHDSTLCRSLGDWFGWLDVGLLCGLALVWFFETSREHEPRYYTKSRGPERRRSALLSH